MENFKYAAGLPGYGTRGVDGSSGLSGLATYFTSYDGTSDRTIIKSKISNNKILFPTDSYLAGYPNRVYQVGDIIIDKNGKVYEITAVGVGADTSYTESQLNTSGLFIPGATPSGINRYSNDYLTENYQVDSVMANRTTLPSDYSLYPSEIYGIPAYNYGKINYSNYSIPGSDYNPFQVYTSGEGDSDSIAIIKDYSDEGNVFRIGNLDASGVVRNVNLIFDVSNLIVSKDAGAEINHYTVDGVVITNHEIGANYLFNPNFTTNPVSFTGYSSASAPTDVSISWNKEDFLNTSVSGILSSVKADLWFYKKDIVYNGQTIDFSSGSDASIYKPFVLHNIENSGSVKFSNLEEGASYETYIKFVYNGWERNSTRLGITTGITESILAVPDSFISQSYLGTEPSSLIISNVGWTATPGNTWITVSPSSGNYEELTDNETVIDISIAYNSGSSRNMYIDIDSSSSSTQERIYVQQSGVPPTTGTITAYIYWESTDSAGSMSGTVTLENGSGGYIDEQVISCTSENGVIVQFTDQPVNNWYQINFSGMNTQIGVCSGLTDSTHEWNNGGAWTAGSTTDPVYLTGSNESFNCKVIETGAV